MTSPLSSRDDGGSDAHAYLPPGKVPRWSGAPVDFEIGVVGAGFAGIIAALELRRMGRESFVVLERADEVGGVWRENVYPGCACDVPSHLYSIASRPNPNWTTSFASQPEILSYLRKISVRDDLRRHIQFGWEVAEACFCAGEGAWELKDSRGRNLRVRTLILAVGPHSRPKFPALKEHEAFAGTMCHSARWDPSVDLRGKRVAVIGTGASAVQIVPAIAPVVDELMVIQRSPPWVLPRLERRLTRFEHWLFRRFPYTQALVRASIYWSMEVIGLGFVGPPVFNRLIAGVALRHLRRQVRDPATRRALSPTYRVGCKRIMVSDDYYPAFDRSNVRLVPYAAVEIVPNGVVTADGVVHQVDHIVYATGFSVADPEGFLRVVGLNGRVLSDEWSATGAVAYLGTTISGYPNLAILLGPNSGLGHSSALHVIESQMSYVANYLTEVDRTGEGGYLDVRAAVQRAYNADLQQKLARTVWGTGCNSWYVNNDGTITVLFPGLTSRFRRRLARFDPGAYIVSRVSSRPAVRSGDTQPDSSRIVHPLGSPQGLQD